MAMRSAATLTTIGCECGGTARSEVAPTAGARSLNAKQAAGDFASSVGFASLSTILWQQPLAAETLAMEASPDVQCNVQKNWATSQTANVAAAQMRNVFWLRLVSFMLNKMS